MKNGYQNKLYYMLIIFLYYVLIICAYYGPKQMRFSPRLGMNNMLDTDTTDVF